MAQRIPGVPSPAGSPAESRGDVNSDNIGPLDAATRQGLPTAEQTEGPDIGPKGEYRKARYELPPVEVADRFGHVKVLTGRIREDR